MRAFVLLLCCALNGPALAQSASTDNPGLLQRAQQWVGDRLPGEKADDWLRKIGPALRQQDYQGVLVHVSGDRIRSMAIYHANENGQERERIVTLSGAPRELVRDGKRVMLVGANGQPTGYDVIDTHGANPAELFVGAEDLQSYDAKLGGSERVAGRAARIIELKARDGFRYGYKLWLDKGTGLPLRMDLLDEGLRPLEQIAFSEIQLGKTPSAEDLRGSQQRPLRRAQTLEAAPGTDPGWRVIDPPQGYELRTARRVGNAVQLLYSDGLAAVTVHVEPAQGAAVGEAISRRGAVNTYSLVYNGVRIVAIGKVPPRTVQAFAMKVRPPKTPAPR